MSRFYPVTGVVVNSGFPIVSQKYTLNIVWGIDAYTYELFRCIYSFIARWGLLLQQHFCPSFHSSIQQPLLILNQSHGWGRGLTQQWVGDRKEYTLGHQSITGHTLTLGGTSEPPFNLLCMFFWNVGVNSLAIKAPSLKSNPELFCHPLLKMLQDSCSSSAHFCLCKCVIFLRKNKKLEISFPRCEENINMAAKYKEKQMYCNFTPCRNVLFPSA